MHFPFFRRHKRSSVEKLAEKAGVVFGENNSFASCFWSSAEPYLIKIGSNCQITADVKIFTHGGSKVARTIYPKFDCFGKVEIGDNVYIGNNSLIMPGVTIGSDVLIAAGSVVCHSVPSGVVVGGNPARIICKVEEYIERNKPYNLDTKGLSRREKKYDFCPVDEGNGMVDSIELWAVSVLAKFADGKISCDDFGDEMMRIGEELKKQMEDCDGNIVIDASVPQWLIMFMGNKFSKWNMMRMQINAARQNPKITSDPRWSEVEKMVKQENDVLMHAVRHSLTLWQND